MKDEPEDIRHALRLRQRAGEKSTRSFMCAGYVRGPNCTVYFFPDSNIREPVVVAKGQVEEVES